MARIPFAHEGWPFVAAFAAFAAGFLLLHWRLAAWIALALALFVTWFFRDPERAIPGGEGEIVSPADGRVIVVEPRGDGGTKISIFLSIFNVHVNRAPVAGEVIEVRHQPGKFLAAWKSEASAENAMTAVTVRTPGGDVRFVQITGLVARRIVCRLRPGDRVARGERYGLIRFGSRMDIHLPAAAEATVRLGDRVRGGADVIARWRE